jgi:hypothetical protein
MQREMRRQRGGREERRIKSQCFLAVFSAAAINHGPAFEYLNASINNFITSLNSIKKLFRAILQAQRQEPRQEFGEAKWWLGGVGRWRRGRGGQGRRANAKMARMKEEGGERVEQGSRRWFVGATANRAPTSSSRSSRSSPQVVTLGLLGSRRLAEGREGEREAPSTHVHRVQQLVGSATA